MTNSFRLNKKGVAAKNIFVAVVFLLVFGFLSMLGVLIGTEFITQFQATGIAVAETSSSIAGFQVAFTLFDKVISLFAIVFIIAIGATSFRLASAPIFFIISFVMAGLYGFISYIFNFIFISMISDAAFATVKLTFPITILICTNLHWVALAMIVVGSLALYAKKPRGQFLDSQ